MGTTYSVQIAETSNLKKDFIKREIDKILLEVNKQMSTYIKTSEISVFNTTETVEPFKVSPWFFKVLDHSLDLAKKTNGAYDPTIGPLVNLWGFGPQSLRAVPDDETVNKVKPFVGYNKVALIKNDEDGLFIKKSHPKVYVDLSSSAKGFAVDMIAENLEKKLIKNYFIEVGGEIRASGTKFNDPWVVAIEEPNTNNRSAFKTFHLRDLSIATSGSYRNYFEEKNTQYSHTIDSSTGKPVVHDMVSVTVLDKSCMKADALATALMAMGPEKAKAFSEKHGLMVYFIYKPETKNGKTDNKKDSNKNNLNVEFKTYSSKTFQFMITVLE